MMGKTETLWMPSILPSVSFMTVLGIVVSMRTIAKCVANIKFKDIMEALAIMKENGVEGVVLKVKGKYDDAPHHLTLWGDDNIQIFALCNFCSCLYSR
jgi:hypothetical protein